MAPVGTRRSPDKSPSGRPSPRIRSKSPSTRKSPSKETTPTQGSPQTQRLSPRQEQIFPPGWPRGLLQADCAGLQSHFASVVLTVSPLMLPFFASLRVGRNRLYLTLPDANHNDFSPKTTKEIINNLYNNLLGEAVTSEKTLGTDLGVVILPTHQEDNAEGVSPSVVHSTAPFVACVSAN